MKSHHCDWNVVLNHELKFRKKDTVDLWFDGIVADYNNIQLREVLEQMDAPIIGLVNGVDNESSGFRHPIVSIDNRRVMEMAHDHLVSKGHTTIAYYGLEDDEDSSWSCSREDTYNLIQSAWGKRSHTYCGQQATFTSWMVEVENLRMWVDALPKPCGIIVSSDIRARTLIGVCETNETIIPDEVSIISIGDMEVSEFFHQTSLTSVDPNHEKMGGQAAEIMNALISGEQVKKVNYTHPELVCERVSTDFQSIIDPFVLRARHYVRLNACKGIKVQQVVDYAGCSRTLLETRFKKQVGLSIHQVIHDLKIEKAKTMLLETSVPIKEVAKLAGYPSAQYLYGLFQKELGITPSEYREQAANEFI